MNDYELKGAVKTYSKYVDNCRRYGFIPLDEETWKGWQDYYNTETKKEIQNGQVQRQAG